MKLIHTHLQFKHWWDGCSKLP